MIRVILQIVIPLVLPTALYLAYATFLRRKDPNAEIDIPKPWFRLAAVGLALVVISLGATAVTTGDKPGGRYVAPRQVDGKIVPGHIVRDKEPGDARADDAGKGQRRH